MKLTVARAHKAELLRIALDRGERSLEELCSLLDVSPFTLDSYVSEFGIVLPDNLTPFRCNPEFDELIARGFPITVIAASHKVTRAWVSKYIRDTRQHSFWREQRMKFLQESKNYRAAVRNFALSLNQVISKFADVLIRVKDNAGKKSWAYDRACLYFERVPHSTHVFERLLGVFEFYEAVFLEDSKLSLAELGAPFRISAQQLSHIFRVVDIAPFYGRLTMHRISSELSDIIARGMRSGLSVGDTAYFAGVRRHVARSVYKRHNVPSPKNMMVVGGFNVWYRQASVVYDLLDYGFEKEDVVGCYLGVDKGVVEALVKHRASVEKIIIKVLKFMHLENADVPYVQSRSHPSQQLS
jgi:predicted transcriptional regulator